VELVLPAGWTAGPPHLEAGRWHFALRSGEVADRSEIGVTAHPVGARVAAEFALLGPGDAKGYPCNVNVPRCDHCGARKEACVCKP